MFTLEKCLKMQCTVGALRTVQKLSAETLDTSFSTDTHDDVKEAISLLKTNKIL